MESTFNNTPHTSGSTSGNSSKKGSGASTSSSYSSGSTGSVGSSSVSSSVGSTGSSSGLSMDKVSNQASNLIDKVKNVDYQEQINKLKTQAGPAYDASVDYVKANPMLAVGGAALVGFFAGMFFCRSK